MFDLELVEKKPIDEKSRPGSLDIDILDVHDRMGGKYTPEEKLNACAVFLVVGSIKKTALYTGIPRKTITDWKLKSTWWPDVLDQLKKQYNEELESKLSVTIDKIMGHLTDRLDNGDTYIIRGKEHKIPVLARNLSSMARNFFEMRALIRGDPTSRTESTSSEKKLDAIAKRLESSTRRRPACSR